MVQLTLPHRAVTDSLEGVDRCREHVGDGVRHVQVSSRARLRCADAGNESSRGVQLESSSGTARYRVVSQAGHLSAVRSSGKG